MFFYFCIFFDLTKSPIPSHWNIRPGKSILTFSPLSRRSAAFRDDFRSVCLQHQCSLDAMHDALGEAKSRRVDANVQAFRLHLLDFLQHVLFVVIDHFNAQSVPGNVQPVLRAGNADDTSRAQNLGPTRGGQSDRSQTPDPDTVARLHRPHLACMIRSA